MIKLEVVKVEDAKDILAILDYYIHHTAIIFDVETPTLEVYEYKIIETLKQYPFITAKEDGELVGFAYVSCFKPKAAYNWSVETTIYIKEGSKKSGIGKKLYLALEAICKQMHITNMNACIASVDHEDPYLDNNSMMFHEHMGYTLVGKFHQCAYKFNRMYDMVWYEKMISDHSDMQPIIYFNDLDMHIINEILNK